MAQPESNREIAADKALNWAAIAHVHMSDARDQRSRACQLDGMLHARADRDRYIQQADDFEQRAEPARRMALMWAAVAAVQPDTD